MFENQRYRDGIFQGSRLTYSLMFIPSRSRLNLRVLRPTSPPTLPATLLLAASSIPTRAVLVLNVIWPLTGSLGASLPLPHSNP